MKIATYNAQFCPKRSKARKAHVAAFATLAAAYPVVGVCEAGGYRSELRNVPGTKVIQPRGSAGRCALLIRDGIRVHASGSYRLHGRKFVGRNVPGARVTGWTKPRDILWALITDPDSGELVVVAVWHPVPGQSHSKRARALLALEAEKAASWLAAQKHPADLMGDTNGDPDLHLFNPLRLLAQPAFAVSRGGSRIDGHWIAGGHGAATALDGYPSDHKPVVADITWGAAPKPAPAPKEHTTVPTFLLDVSNFQANGLDLDGDNLRAQGYVAVIPKASEGATFRDSTFAGYRAQAEREGMGLAAYHFLSTAPAAEQAKTCASVVGDPSVPIMIDLEAHGATMKDARAFRSAMKALGYHVALLYLPHWYWQRIGSPSLRGWRVVSSAYQSSRHLYGSALYPGANGTGWQPYGGVKPFIWQFASSGRVDGYSGNVDLDAFEGTEAELRKSGAFLWPDAAAKPAHPRKPAPAPAPAAPAPKPALEQQTIAGAHTISQRAAKHGNKRRASKWRALWNSMRGRKKA
ncbi:MAG TPA: GH25 family lysozyme [Solirubrobacteraceae bacterium]|nr:GH25 family lysozyme [Solirubrobacteraceae bacterium]